ncbi:unnamed protein product, partial [Adineta steineri]
THRAGLIDIAIKAICKNRTYSGLYEICALCSVLKCNIRSVYPEIDFIAGMAVMNSIFTPIPPIVANYEVAVLWSNVRKEMHVRAVTNNTWTPNHFVSLLAPNQQYDFDHRNQLLLSNVKTPEKKTFKNNAVAQIRIPEFKSSPNRRVRSDINIESERTKPTSPNAIEQAQADTEEEHENRLSLLRERARLRRVNQTEEQRQNQLAKDRERTQSRRESQAEEQRQDRLAKDRERTRCRRRNETDDQYQLRINYQRDRTEHQYDKEKKSQIHSTWPAPIPTDLKKECLQQFLSQMSMSVLAEVTCAVCNIRSSEQESIKMPMSEIPDIHLLKISDELKNLVINTQSSTSENSNGSSTSKSSYFYYENDIILYVNGIYQEILISNILDTMILGGVVGPVKAYFGTVESQGRASLHLHFLIWLNHDLKPADMKQKIQDPSFRENLIAYLEDIIKEDLDEFNDKCIFENLDGIRDFFNFNIAFFFYIATPRSLNTPTQLSSDNIYAALRTTDLAGLEENTNANGIRLTPMKDQSSPSIPYASPPNLRGSPSIPYASPPNLHGSPSIPYASPQRTELLQTPIHDQSISSMDVSDIQPRLPPACLPTPNPSLPNFWSRFCAYVTQLVESGNVHRHSDTCYKYCK